MALFILPFSYLLFLIRKELLLTFDMISLKESKVLICLGFSATAYRSPEGYISIAKNYHYLEESYVLLG